MPHRQCPFLRLRAEARKETRNFTSHRRCGEWGSISLERAQGKGGGSSKLTFAGTALNSKSKNKVQSSQVQESTVFCMQWRSIMRGAFGTKNAQERATKVASAHMEICHRDILSMVLLTLAAAGAVGRRRGRLDGGGGGGAAAARRQRGGGCGRWRGSSGAAAAQQQGGSGAAVAGGGGEAVGQRRAVAGRQRGMNFTARDLSLLC